MFTRSFRAGAGAATLAVAALTALTVVPAQADPAGVPSATDLVGVGSDTSQFVVTNLADGATVNGEHVKGWNEVAPAGSPKLASFDACTVPAGALYPCTGGGNITIRPGGGTGTTIVRPNGSGAGKGLLYGANNNDNVTFARSSAALSTAEASAGLQAYPFAMDTLVMVTSKKVATNAPLNLSGTQILKIYTGKITDWSQVDATRSGVIVPEIPQTGSGTRSFFLSQLQTVNGGVAPTLATSVKEVQEHDPSSVQDNPNAIAPFSLGRANLAGSLQVEKGFSARRALYNVVRGSSSAHPEWVVGAPQVEAVFGMNGFLCSPDARPLIEAAGFKQLKSDADGGVCGVPTQGATNELSVYNEDGTPSQVGLTLGATSSTYGNANVARVSVTGAGGTPSGPVTVTAGSFSTSADLVNGAVDVPLPATLGAGTVAVKATFAGDDTFRPSEKSVSLTINKANVAITSKLPTTVAKGKKATGKVKVALTPANAELFNGTVTITRSGKTWGTGKVVNGVATVTLKALVKGKNTLTITVPAAANTNAATLKITITQK